MRPRPDMTCIARVCVCVLIPSLSPGVRSVVEGFFKPKPQFADWPFDTQTLKVYGDRETLQLQKADAEQPPPPQMCHDRTAAPFTPSWPVCLLPDS